MDDPRDTPNPFWGCLIGIAVCGAIVHLLLVLLLLFGAVQ